MAEQKISDTEKITDNGVTEKYQELVRRFYWDEIVPHVRDCASQEYTQARHQVTLTCSCGATFTVHTIIKG